MNTYDAVVVGGRVAGASTALLLARAGAKVVLVDRGRRGSDTVSTHGLMRAGVLQLLRWGVLPDVIAAGTPPVRNVIFHYTDSESVRVTLRPSAGIDALYAPRRQLIDRLLVDAAAAAGAEVLHETTVTGLLHDSTDRIAGARVLRRRGGTADLHASFTIGADGIRSLVAEEVAAPTIRQGMAEAAFIYRYLDDLPPEGYEWAYGPGAAAGLIPTNDATCVFVATTPARLRQLRRDGSEQAFRTVLATAAPTFVERVAAASHVSNLRGWAGAPGFLRRCWGPGWVLVGDAGYFRDPITTHGMSDALRDAELAADALLAVLSGAPEKAALSAYERMRDGLSRQMFAVTEAVAAFDWDLDRIRLLLREVSLAMADEVDYLQALPERRIPSGNSALAEATLR
jgi:2-polyprenyl-6-methoxyphenol hydroxylase-like FAD-dependent oxidoreductase